MNRLILLSIMVLLWQVSKLEGQISKPNDTEKSVLTSTFSCAPYVEIDKFRDKATNRNWKVIVGKKIKFKANPKDQEPYNWKLGHIMGDNVISYWPLDDNGTAPIVTSTDRSGIFYIPNANLPMDNSHFGETHGTAEVRIAGNPDELFNRRQVEIFYEKDDNNHNNPAQKNWFFYWSQLIQNRLNGITYQAYVPADDPDMDPLTGDDGWELRNITVNVLYTPTAPGLTLNNYGFSNKLGSTQINLAGFQASTAGDGTQLQTLTNVVANISLGDLCSRVCGQKYITCADPPTSTTSCPYGGSMDVEDNQNQISTGIHCFLRVLEHELEHVRIFGELWTNYRYISANNNHDTDGDNDRYPDAWEDLGPPQDIYDFNSMDITDRYGHPGTTPYLPTDYPGVTAGASSGSNYEEIRCRMHEYGVNKTVLDGSDWSHTGESFHSAFQGKQW